MVRTCWKNQKIIPPQPDSHPVIVNASDIEKAFTVQDVTDLLVFMEVFVKEHFDLFFIHLNRQADWVSVVAVLRLGSWEGPSFKQYRAEVFRKDTVERQTTYRAHFLGRNCDFITVSIGPFGSYSIDLSDGRTMVVQNTKVRKVLGIDRSARVVVLTLVALTKY